MVKRMEDPERTVIWRRPGSGTNGVARRTEEGGPVVEPVRSGDPVVNVNQPGTEPHGLLAPSPPSPVQVAVWRAQRVIYYIAGLIEVIVAIRFILKLIAANPTSPFVQGVYGVSWVFAFPFNGVVPNLQLAGSSVIELFCLVAIAVYVLASVALAKLLDLLI